MSEEVFTEIKRYLEMAVAAIARVEDLVAGIVTAIVAIAGLASAGILVVAAQPEQFRGLMNVVMLGAVGVWAIIRFLSMYSARFMERTVIRAAYFVFVLNAAILIFSYRLYLNNDPIWPYMFALSSAIVATMFVLSVLGYGLFRILQQREFVEQTIKAQEELFKQLLEAPSIPQDVKEKLAELRLRNLRLVDVLVSSMQRYAGVLRGSNVLGQAVVIAAIATGTSIAVGSLAATAISPETFLWVGVIETVVIILAGLLVWYLTRLQERMVHEELSSILKIVRA